MLRQKRLDITAKTTLIVILFLFSSEIHFFKISWEIGAERWYLERKLSFSILRQKRLDVTAKTILTVILLLLSSKIHLSKISWKIGRTMVLRAQTDFFDFTAKITRAT